MTTKLTTLSASKALLAVNQKRAPCHIETHMKNTVPGEHVSRLDRADFRSTHAPSLRIRPLSDTFMLSCDSSLRVDAVRAAVSPRTRASKVIPSETIV